MNNLLPIKVQYTVIFILLTCPD